MLSRACPRPRSLRARMYKCVSTMKRVMCCFSHWLHRMSCLCVFVPRCDWDLSHNNSITTLSSLSNVISHRVVCPVSALGCVRFHRLITIHTHKPVIALLGGSSFSCLSTAIVAKTFSSEPNVNTLLRIYFVWMDRWRFLRCFSYITGELDFVYVCVSVSAHYNSVFVLI